MDRAEAIAFFERKKVALEKSEYILLGRNAYDAFCSAVDALREQEQREWISAKERLPEKSGWLLTFGPQRKHEVVYFSVYEQEWSDLHDNGIEVTHWMPLPEPPEEGA